MSTGLREMRQFHLSRRISIEAWREPRALSLGVAVAWSPYSVNISFHLGDMGFGATWYRGAFLTHFKDTRHAR